MMNTVVISGIQQVGIGVANLHEAWKWYRKNFGVDIKVFEEKAEAALMTKYTGGKPRSRHAALALNLQGGGGFEIWQYTDRVPESPSFEIGLGDTGIFAVKIKSKDVEKTYKQYKDRGLDLLGGLRRDPDGNPHFFVKDPYGNIFQIVDGSSWFREEKKLTGSTYGVIIGSTNIDKAKSFYSRILGYDKVVYDKTGEFEDFNGIPGGGSKMRRLLLAHSQERKGGFSRVFGFSNIELVSLSDKKPKGIFQDRFWGDLGFIHLCYDIKGMSNLKKICKKEGFPFTIDSMADHNIDGFDMGEASGHFSYVEDPDGTLIEFVEAHRIPIIKKLGIYLNLRKRDPLKRLPDWMLKGLRFNRIKD